MVGGRSVRSRVERSGKFKGVEQQTEDSRYAEDSEGYEEIRVREFRLTSY